MARNYPETMGHRVAIQKRMWERERGEKDQREESCLCDVPRQHSKASPGQRIWKGSHGLGSLWSEV